MQDGQSSYRTINPKWFAARESTNHGHETCHQRTVEKPSQSVPLTARQAWGESQNKIPFGTRSNRHGVPFYKASSPFKFPLQKGTWDLLPPPKTEQRIWALKSDEHS